MNIQEIANEHSREIIKNIFSKLDDEEKYVILELNNQLQDKINKIDKAIEILNAMKHCQLLLDGKEKTNIDRLLEILGGEKDE